ncbi:MAG: hypothetical protein PHI66_00305 [Candidatus Pacebacteria bacterium]|nr:hypothetical protein [Candidatus Paceibacterota bacterium]
MPREKNRKNIGDDIFSVAFVSVFAVIMIFGLSYVWELLSGNLFPNL